jgi:hypothetical protein
LSTVTGLDHVIIAVDDLDSHETVIRRLGFVTTPRGMHSTHKGTANVTTVLADRSTYLELLGITHPTGPNAPVRAALAKGRRLVGIALKTADAAATAERFLAEGIGTGEVNAFSRPVELPGGTREAAFRTTYVRPDQVDGAFVFACEHLTPDVVWREDHLQQPNAAVALVEVAGVCDDLEAMAHAWSPILPDAPVTREDDRVVVPLGNAVVSFARPDAYAARFGAAPTADPGLGALVLRTADADQTRAALAAEGVIFRESGDLIVTPPGEGGGVTFAFSAA